MHSVIIKTGHEKSLARHHPWIFSGAIAEVRGAPESGETVEVLAGNREFLARGAYSPSSDIRVRVWSFDPEEEIRPEFFRSRLERAIRHRDRLGLPSSSDAYRIVNSESDGLPGLIVDRYARFLVCQFLSAGAEYWKTEIVASLSELTPCDGIYERSDAGARGKEGLELRTGRLAGEEPPAHVEIREGQCRFMVDVVRGHKTGFYLDQRDNRAAIAEYAEGAEVLNCFSYTGAFGIHALRGGAARVSNVESSAEAIDLARLNAELNGVDVARIESIDADAFQVLRRFRDSRRSFDVAVLDPPKFAESQYQLARACRGYKDINLLAFKLLRPGGFLFTFSCSGHMKPDLFDKVVADAALDAGRDAQIVRRLTQAPDHATALNFPEGLYLKGLLCRVW